MENELNAYAEPTLYRHGRFAKVFVACFALSIFSGYLFSYIQDFFFPTLPGNPLDKESITEQLFLACLIAPLIETWIFQYGANKVLIKLGLHNFYLLLLIPAALFGLSHYYNPLYIIAMFIGGTIMNYLFLYGQANGYKAFWWVALLHALYNLYGILLG